MTTGPNVLLVNHNGLGVGLEVYTMSDREQKREAVNELEAMVTL